MEKWDDEMTPIEAHPGEFCLVFKEEQTNNDIDDLAPVLEDTMVLSQLFRVIRTDDYQ